MGLPNSLLLWTMSRTAPHYLGIVPSNHHIGHLSTSFVSSGIGRPLAHQSLQDCVGDLVDVNFARSLLEANLLWHLHTDTYTYHPVCYHNISSAVSVFGDPKHHFES
eukprot:scaffold65449_cov33-Tisochrysis_lutea.AAC.1